MNEKETKSLFVSYIFTVIPDPYVYLYYLARFQMRKKKITRTHFR